MSKQSNMICRHQQESLAHNLPKANSGRSKVLVVSPYFYPKLGGAENYALTLARLLQESGDYQVSIVTSNHTSNTYYQDTVAGMRVHRLPPLFKLSNTPINPSWYWWLKRIYAAEQPDLIHLHSPVPFLADIAALAAKSIPLILTYHAGSMKKGSWAIDMIICVYERIFLRWLFRRVDAIAAVSADFAQRELQRYANKTTVISPGVNTKLFSPSPVLKDNLIITYVGRIEHTSKWKGVDVLLAAMVEVIKRHPQAQLELVGGGDAIEHYRAYAERLGIQEHTTFCGQQVENALTAAYQRSSVVVLPSTTEAESFGMVLLEAMACGTPVIGSRIGGIPAVIAHEQTGLLVTPNAPLILAEAIDRLLTDGSFSRRIAKNALLKVQVHDDWRTKVSAYLKLYSHVGVTKAEPESSLSSSNFQHTPSHD